MRRGRPRGISSGAAGPKFLSKTWPVLRSIRGMEISSEQRFQTLIDNIPDYAIFMLDSEGRVTTWNDGAQRVKGYRADEIIGRHFSIFYTPEDVLGGKPEQEMAIARAQGRYAGEGFRVRNDGA